MSLIKNIKIYDTEYKKIRVGNEKDGGYVLPDEILSKCEVLYSYGVNDDVSFEKDCLLKNSKINARLFDHTIDKLPEEHNNFSFKKEGLSSEKKDQLNSLENQLKEYNDLNKPNKILKIDIEWNEWDVFQKMPIEILNQFDIIICEFHFIPVEYNSKHTPYFTSFHKFVYDEINENLFNKYQEVLNKVLNFYYIYHIHINNSLPLNNIKGNQFPPLVEFCLINKTIVKNPTISKSKYPIDNLDFPNKPYKPDILNFEWSQNE